jgi:sortase (surface protein transpeptidase)
VVNSAFIRNYLQNPDLPKEKLTPVTTGKILSESAPVRLRIPAIKVDASFVELGLNANKEIEVPKSFTEVGWYIHGPTPGELGPAIVLGHVDSRVLGAAVFYYLGQLKPGDTIEIDRKDGSTAIFRVDELERYSQSDFPTKLVYGNIDHAGLRLITCTGTYDHSVKRYDHNLVVYASLIDSR